MASKLKDTSLDFGFVQVPVSIFTAAEDDELDLRSLCHDKPPRMTVRCEEGGEEFTSWQKVPQRGYEWAKGEFIILSPEEIASAKEKRTKVETMKVEKAVDFEKTGTRYVYTGGYVVLPQEKSPETARGNYRAIVEVLQEAGRAVLCRFAPRDKVRHYAVAANDEGFLVAYEIRERRPLPYAVSKAAADPKVKAQAKMLVESIHTDDVALEKEEDPLFELIRQKVEATQGSLLPGIGQTSMVPQ